MTIAMHRMHPAVVFKCKRENVQFEYRLSHLLAHGLLHLLGYDHHTTTDFRHMRRREIKLLNAMAEDERSMGLVPSTDPDFVSYLEYPSEATAQINPKPTSA
jgi:hypothetical protein